jgi:dsRNA-specific ribonuclease
MNSTPPLPKIEGDVDLLLDVYTHKSLRFGGAPFNDEYGDTERLAELGARVLDLAVTFYFYSRKPMLTASEIAVRFPHNFRNQLVFILLCSAKKSSSYYG